MSSSPLINRRSPKLSLFRCRCSDPTSEDCKPMYEAGDCETEPTTNESTPESTTTTTPDSSPEPTTTTTTTTDQGECSGKLNLHCPYEGKSFLRGWARSWEKCTSLHLWKMPEQLQTIPRGQPDMWKWWVHSNQWPKIHVLRQKVLHSDITSKFMIIFQWNIRWNIHFNSKLEKLTFDLRICKDFDNIEIWRVCHGKMWREKRNLHTQH